jgi:hypothetical protein
MDLIYAAESWNTGGLCLDHALYPEVGNRLAADGRGFCCVAGSLFPITDVKVAF